MCGLNTVTNELHWSGANNPLWYFQNNELKEIKGDKQPIGNYAEQKPFTSHTIKLQKGDCLFVFTDGYADLFGGPKGKKFKYKQLQDEPQAIHNKPLANQKEILDKLFEDWRNNLEQLNDVCIIGVKI